MEPEELERSFAGKAELVLRVFDAYLAEFEAAVQAAFDAEPRWPVSLRAAAYECVRWMNAHPAATQFGIVGALQAPELLRVRREAVLRWAAGLIDRGRGVVPDPAAVPDGAALIAIGSIADGVTGRVAGRTLDDPVALIPRLMYMAVRPYLGEAAARAELAVPPPGDFDSPPG